MRIGYIITCAVGISLMAGTAFANGKTPPGQRDGGSLGALTKEAIANGFDQGSHASDPSGDGRGPGTADEPRSGLANVAGRGDLSATLDVVQGALGD